MEETTSTAGSTTESAPATTVGNASAALALADATSAAAPQATEATPSAATTPTETPAAEPSTEVKGEPPKWRWQDILANARETSAKEAEEKIRQQYKWAQDIADHERDGLLTWRAAMNGDERAIARIRETPQAVQWLQSLVAQQQQAQAADREPEPDLQAADNTLVYSAPQLKKWQEWNQRQLTAQIEKRFEDRLKPLQETAQTFRQEKAQATYTTNVTQAVAKLKQSDPDFEKYAPAVGELLQSDARLLAMATGDNGREPDPETALEIAWSRVYRSKVLPLRQQQTEAKVLTDLQQRAVAATTNPATASTATPKPTLGNARAALEHAHQLLGS